ncbi:hypothetical protein [Nocardia brasiliensis]|uniref:hypothetical protein n=1 Tax=Nocardia brasiliensis TaxID=37326 RepID=UPI002458EAAC|nr:hypothetical protein [Nocardia brasiliensis]
MSSRTGATSGTSDVERELPDELVQAQAYVDFVLDQRGDDCGSHKFPLHAHIAVNVFISTVLAEGLDKADLTSDLELYLALAKFGFAGPAWDEVIAEPLTRHGAAVLTAWSRSGWIFKVLQDKDVRLTPPASDIERRRLAGDVGMQQELVRPAVAAALVKFQRELQSRSGWTPTGGLSMSAYFIGSCVFAFGNEFRKWRRRDRGLPSSGQQSISDLANFEFGDSWSSMFTDPEAAAVASGMIRDAFSPLAPEDRIIVLAKAWGYTAIEIVELYPDLTKKAVEQRWARLKGKHAWINRLSDSVRGA